MNDVERILAQLSPQDRSVIIDLFTTKRDMTGEDIRILRQLSEPDKIASMAYYQSEESLPDDYKFQFPSKDSFSRDSLISSDPLTNIVMGGVNGGMSYVPSGNTMREITMQSPGGEINETRIERNPVTGMVVDPTELEDDPYFPYSGPTVPTEWKNFTLVPSVLDRYERDGGRWNMGRPTNESLLEQIIMEEGQVPVASFPSNEADMIQYALTHGEIPMITPDEKKSLEYFSGNGINNKIIRMDPSAAPTINTKTVYAPTGNRDDMEAIKKRFRAGEISLQDALLGMKDIPMESGGTFEAPYFQPYPGYQTSEFYKGNKQEPAVSSNLNNTTSNTSSNNNSGFNIPNIIKSLLLGTQGSGALTLLDLLKKQ